jgi:RHS repeat-associated protein
VYEGTRRVARVRIDGTGNTNTETFINNYQGSPVVVLSSTGNIQYQKYLDPWGNLEMEIGHPSSNIEFQYTDKELDEDTGLYNFHARYRDPVDNRFYGRDRVKLEDNLTNYFGINPYVFVNNNPIRYLDPNGLYVDIQYNEKTKEVLFRMPIRYTGDGATPEKIQQFNKGIEQHWTGQFGRYTVKTEVVNPNFLDDILGHANNIEVSQEITRHKKELFNQEDNSRAYVARFGDYASGKWQANSGEWPAKSSDGWTAAHEFGHLAGVGDKYKDVFDKKGNFMGSRALPGWGRNILGASNGIVEERNIEEILINNNILAVPTIK